MLRAGLQFLDGAARLVSDAVASGTETLVLPRARPGTGAEASVWVHNRTTSVVASVELRATVLISAEEHTIPADAVTFHPEGAVVLEPCTCREVSVRVSVPAGPAARALPRAPHRLRGARRCGHPAPRGGR